MFFDTTQGVMAPLNDYLDAILIYTPTVDDLPLEEPSALTPLAVSGNTDTTTTIEAQGIFNRLNSSGDTVVAYLNVSQNVYWTLGDGVDPVDPSIATISNRGGSSTLPAGTITWGVNALPTTSIQVNAQRGPNTANCQASPPAGFQAPQRVPSVVNIYPGGAEPETFPAPLAFNMQVLYSDGTTSDPPTQNSPDSVENENFTFTASDTSVCTPVSGEPGHFTVSGGNSTGNITITAQHNTVTTLSATATIKVPTT
jgi:hypothetical protein